MQRKNVIIDDLNISYLQSDDFDWREPLVFLHGWKSEAAHLFMMLGYSSNYLAVDLPGFGQSQRPAESWGVPEYAVFLKQFLQKLNIENPTLIGHSFGGAVIVSYASEQKEIKKIILIDSAGIRKTGLKIFIYKILAKIMKVFLLIPPLSFYKDKVRKIIYKAIDSEDYIQAGYMTKIYKKIIRQDLSEKMKKIDVPTTLIWGDKDTMTPLWQAKSIVSKIVGSKLKVIEGAGHFPFVEKSREFEEIFLKEIKEV